jgi:hypothetical protein
MVVSTLVVVSAAEPDATVGATMSTGSDVTTWFDDAPVSAGVEDEMVVSGGITVASETTGGATCASLVIADGSEGVTVWAGVAGAADARVRVSCSTTGAPAPVDGNPCGVAGSLESGGAASVGVVVVGDESPVVSVVTGTGCVVEPGASVAGSVPTPVSVEVVAGDDVVVPRACGVPSWSVVTGADAIAPASADTAAADANGPVDGASEAGVLVVAVLGCVNE